MNPAFPPIREGEFVERVGSGLRLANRAFRFSGNNTYYLQAEIAARHESAVFETLDKMAELGMSVARANAHNDHPPAMDPAAIQIEPGVFEENNLVALDRSIAEARNRNIRLILKLTNYWEAYGGIGRYVAWRLGRNPSPAELSRFYTGETIKQWFKNYVRMILTRRNTITGSLYNEEPAILAWELGNELRNPAGTAEELLNWMSEIAAFIRTIDPNHLIADGGEGFDNDPGLYGELTNLYAVGGSEGCSYHRMVEIADIDLASYHLYPALWGLNDTTDAVQWIRRHEEIARAAKKVAYLGEYGWRGQSPENFNDHERAQVFSRWLHENAVNQCSAGHIAWQLIDDGRCDSEGYQIHYPGHRETCEILRRYSPIVDRR